MLILVAHGSRDPRWRGSLHTLSESVGTLLPGTEVRVAFMQFDGPTLPEVLEEAVGSGHTRLRLLPLFMATAGHVEKDVTPLAAELAIRFPEVEIQLLTPVGEDDLFPTLVAEIASRP